MSTVSEKPLLDDAVRALAVVLFSIGLVGVYGRVAGDPGLARLLEFAVDFGLFLSAGALWSRAEGRPFVAAGALGWLTVGVVRLAEYADVSLVQRGWVGLVTIAGSLVGLVAFVAAFADEP
ncbi:hypothetical protein [Haloprofundus halobius]|uniref:hypothetical protein n=1 Tax=Haloprofundus halobius TaxID=2876194 RepID=UPI001CD02A0D|nr:hypothetical protein [Haloprofundus halobius]